MKHDIQWSCELCEYDLNPQDQDSCEMCGYVENTDITIPSYLDRIFVKQATKETQ